MPPFLMKLRREGLVSRSGLAGATLGLGFGMGGGVTACERLLCKGLSVNWVARDL